MKINRSFSILLGLGVLVALWVFWPADDSQTYTAVLKRLITVDDTYAEKIQPEKIYISRTFYDSFADIEGQKQRKDLKIQKELEVALSEYARTLGANLIWIDAEDSIEYEDTGAIKGGGVLVRLNKAKNYLFYTRVSGSIYIAHLAAGGAKYDFLKIFGHWKYLYKSSEWIS